MTLNLTFLNTGISYKKKLHDENFALIQTFKTKNKYWLQVELGISYFNFPVWKPCFEKNANEVLEIDLEIGFFKFFQSFHQLPFISSKTPKQSFYNDQCSEKIIKIRSLFWVYLIFFRRIGFPKKFPLNRLISVDRLKLKF